MFGLVGISHWIISIAGGSSVDHALGSGPRELALAARFTVEMNLVPAKQKTMGAEKSALVAKRLGPSDQGRACRAAQVSVGRHRVRTGSDAGSRRCRRRAQPSTCRSCTRGMAASWLPTRYATCNRNSCSGRCRRIRRLPIGLIQSSVLSSLDLLPSGLTPGNWAGTRRTQETGELRIGDGSPEVPRPVRRATRCRRPYATWARQQLPEMKAPGTWAGRFRRI